MEDNFRELKMALTKKILVEEYAIAVQTIEDKDKEINIFKSKINQLNSEVTDLKKEIIKINKIVQDKQQEINQRNNEGQPDYNKIINNLKVELEEYKAIYEKNIELYNELVKDTNFILESYEGFLKIVQVTNDNQISLFDKVRKDLLTKFGGKD